MGGDAGVIHFSRELVYNCIVYTIAAANEYWLIDWMSSLYGIRLPVLCAMLQNASWPIQLVLYYSQRKAWEKENGERVITRDMYKSYIILGGLNTIISITRTVGLTSLPPTLYVIIANTEIIFEVMMSRFLLGKPANRLQRIAILLVMAGVLIALYDPVNHRFGSNQSVSQTTLLVGVFLSLLSRFTSALNTVLADK
jgi:drug/metabolite transporter (DMT)-like permease